MSFTFFSKTLDPLVTENGSKQVNVTTQTSFILIVKLTYFRSLARLVCTIFSLILGDYLSLKLSVLITLLSIFHLARISRNENFSVLFFIFRDAQNRQNETLPPCSDNLHNGSISYKDQNKKAQQGQQEMASWASMFTKKHMVYCESMRRFLGGGEAYPAGIFCRLQVAGWNSIITGKPLALRRTYEQ